MPRQDTTRTQVFGLFVVAETPSLTMGQLVRLGTAVGLSETNIKSHVSRLCSDGSLMRMGEFGASRYALSEARRRIVESLRERMVPLEKRREPWSGRWWLLGLHLPGDRVERDHARKRLRFAGMRAWGGNAWICPAWPQVEMRRRLAKLARDMSAIACEGELTGNLDAVSTFELERLERVAAGLLLKVQRALADLAKGLDGRSALKLRHRLGGTMARYVSEAPYLPPELLEGRASPSLLLTRLAELEATAGMLSREFILDALANEGQLSKAAVR